MGPVRTGPYRKKRSYLDDRTISCKIGPKGPKTSYSSKTKSLEEKCSKGSDMQESSAMSHFKFLTYPILGNLPVYLQKKIENKWGKKTYNACNATVVSAIVNLIGYTIAGFSIGIHYASTPAFSLPASLGLLIGGAAIETSVRVALSDSRGGYGSIPGKILFGIDELIMKARDKKKEKVGKVKKEVERMQEEEANKPTKLELFKELIDLEQDKLTPKLKSIAKLGEKLLNRQTDNEVTKGILDMYSPYVEEYIEKAGEYAKDYRSSTSHLQSFNIQEIKKEIKILRENVKKGQKYYKKALQEKEGTLKNIKTIKENREEIEAKLWETQATLQSFHTSIINVETGTDKEQAMKEIQSTVSTLGKALDQNFGKVEEEILEEKVSVG